MNFHNKLEGYIDMRVMKKVNFKRIIFISSLVMAIYLLISIFFMNHYFFNTIINGVNVSLKTKKSIDHTFKNYLNGYELNLVERDGSSENIKAAEIGMQYNENNHISEVKKRQFALQWIKALYKPQKYYLKDTYLYDHDRLKLKINELHCLNRDITKPRNVNFRFNEGVYELIPEEAGNQIKEDKLYEAIATYLLKGLTELNLNYENCYENPRYTLQSEKTQITLNLLTKFAATKIYYIFGNRRELVDGNVIKEWLMVDDNLDIKIKQEVVIKYMKELSKKYDTVGSSRCFMTSLGKEIKIKGGLYGWKINQEEEVSALLKHISEGKVIEKEPAYIQKALGRGNEEIGNTYVEINITKQRLWFYKDGKLITQGPVVTGNPNRGNATVLGVYMINYKQKEATLKGPGYEAKVTYWMPFYGNMGIHDASWRSSFGGEIYKRRGTHGCVNSPIYLAKKIFEHIEEGIPVIVYEEE